MKRLNYILLFCLILTSSLKTFAADTLQLSAEKLYAEKKYKQTIAIYDSILKQGYTSYKLHFNLGNAYYKNNELGKAIYNYELANKLLPNNDDIKTNLRIANEKTIDKIESKENFFMSVIKSRLVNSLSTSGWAWLSIVSLLSTFCLLFLFFIFKNIMVKRIGFFAGTFCFIIFVSSMVLGFSALQDKEHIKFAIVITHEIRTHEEPSDASTSKFNLHEGTRVRVIESENNWTNIKLENGNEAWVKTQDLGLF